MQPSFRIRNKDIEKLKKLNRATQRKQRRLSNLFDVTINNTLQSIDDFESRKEFNEYVANLESFTDYKSHRYVKNKNNLVVERSLFVEAQNIVKKLNKVNKKTLDEIKAREHTDQGVATGWSVDDALYKMGDPRLNRFRGIRFNFDAFSTEEGLRNYIAMKSKQADPKRRKKSDETLRKNYKKALRSVFESKATNIIRAINLKSLDEFLYIFYTENVADFDFIYSFQNWVVKLLLISRIWGVKPHLIEVIEGML